ncbi:MAG: HAD family phosphatase, partial [Oscillospiraceae bacterium]
ENNMIFKGAIFDLDGTLLDSMHVWAKIDRDFLGKRGISVPKDYLSQVAAMSLRETADYTVARFSLQEKPEMVIKEWKAMALWEYGHRISLKAHAREYLLTLAQHGIKLAVATGLCKELYSAVLHNTGILPLFDAVCSVDDVGRGKQFPDIYLYAAKCLSLSPKDCIVFEDVPEAIATAKRAGLKVYGIHDKFGEPYRTEIEIISDGYCLDFRDAPLPD